MADEKGGIPSAFWKGAAGAVGAAATVWLMGWTSPVWSFCHQAFTSLVVHLMAQSQWPNWSAYFLSVPAAIVVFCLATRYLRSRNDSQARFNQFSFLGAVWRWESISSLPYGLQPYCEACDLLLVFEEIQAPRYSGESHRLALHCERCRTVPLDEVGDMAYVRGRVSREIDRLIRTGQWRQHVPESLPK